MPVLLHDRLSTFNTQQAVGLCFPGMTTSLAKSKHIIGVHFQTFFYNILIFWCSWTFKYFSIY